MEKVKFATMFNPQPTVSVDSGKQIYEWEYIAEDDEVVEDTGEVLHRKGELVKDKSNVYEKIQSFERQTNFKKRIERGETFYDGDTMDISPFGNSNGNIEHYFNGIVDYVEKAIKERQSTKEVVESTRQSQQTTIKSAEVEPKAIDGGGK